MTCVLGLQLQNGIMMLLIGLSMLTVTTMSQESPIIKFDSIEEQSSFISFRTNVCDRQQMLFHDEIELPDALRGLSISVGINDYRGTPDENFFALQEDGTLPNPINEYPGIYAVILDELARRGGFEWRNKVGTFPPLDSQTTLTWSDMIYDQVEHFDISMGYWTRILDRLAHGVSYPEGWWDSSVILVEMQTAKSDDTVFDMFAFLAPFTFSVWTFILMTIFFSGVSYWFLERLNPDTDESNLQDKPMGAIFLASMAFVGHNEYKPNTVAARIMNFSWTFCCILVMSAYTANLASFLVVARAETFTLTSFEDAVKYQIPVCSMKGTAHTIYLKQKYPDLTIVENTFDVESYQALSKGICGAMASELSMYHIHQGNLESNPDCSLRWDGRIQEIFPSGFVTAVDAGTYCTSLVSHVLDYHMIHMKIDGFMESAWKNHLKRGTAQCIEKDEGSGGLFEDTNALSLKEMGGIFVFHILLTALAIAYALFEFFYLDKRKTTELAMALDISRHSYRTKEKDLEGMSDTLWGDKSSLQPWRSSVSSSTGT